MHKKLFWLTALALLVPQAFATTIPVAGDATVSSAAPGTNYGATANLVVNSTNNALLQFPLVYLPSGTTSAQVSKATLTIFVNRVNNPGGGIAAQGLSAAFTESSVTSSSRPAAAGTLQSLSDSPLAAGTFLSFDVTTYVQAAVNSSYTYAGFSLAPTSSSKQGTISNPVDIRIDSKENDATAHPAMLDVTLINQGATGANGTNGGNGNNGSNGAPGATATSGTSALVSSQTWTANLAFPTTLGNDGNSTFLATPIGLSTPFNGTPNQVAVMAPNDCTARNLTVSAPGIATRTTSTVRLLGSAGGALTCTIAPQGSTCNSANQTVAVTAGSPLYLHVTLGSTPAFQGNNMLVSFVCQ